jgi:hypothetical protein
MPPYTYQWVFNTMHFVHGFWILNGRSAATEYQRRYPLCSVSHWNTFQITQNYGEPDSITRGSAESWQTRLGEKWRLDAVRRGSSSPQVLYMQSNVPACTPVQTRLFNWQRPKQNVTCQLLVKSTQYFGGKTWRRSLTWNTLSLKGGKFIFSKINLSIHLYIKRHAEHGAWNTLEPIIL